MNTPRRYRKKPVEIEAIQWTGDNLADVIAWCGHNATHQPDGGLSISTLEGTMWARPGDWIIRGVQGECYPCKPDIFAATYDAAE